MYITSADLKRFQVFDIQGNTYEHREALRAMGAVYNPSAKRWTLRIASGSHAKQAAARSFELSKAGLIFRGVR